MLANALYADSSIKICTGIYLGSGLPALEYNEETSFMDVFTYGVDVQTGYGFGLFNDLVLNAYANMGMDSGLPNQPNIYYGVIGELLWGGRLLKYGIALGAGYNTSIDISNNNLESFYFRISLPVVFLGFFKTSICYDLYPEIGSRLGLILHYSQGFSY